VKLTSAEARYVLRVRAAGAAAGVVVRCLLRGRSHYRGCEGFLCKG
jgi:hypothetical protein